MMIATEFVAFHALWSADIVEKESDSMHAWCSHALVGQTLQSSRDDDLKGQHSGRCSCRVWDWRFARTGSVQGSV